MPKPNLIDDRDKRTIHRRLAKQNYDNIITLSADRTQTVRLLDEGAVVMANGNIDFYIQKGTLQKFMDALTEGYVGSVNLGHERFASFPILLGSWTREDMHLVDIGDDRKGLDVDLHLDYDNPLMKAVVQSAEKYGYDLGVSAEFSYHVNEEASYEWGVMIIDDLFIHDFAIVGDAGNVNSMGIQLKGEPMAISMKELSAKLNVEGNDLKSLNDAIDKLLETPSAENAEQVEEQLEAAEEAEETLETTEETEEVTEEASLNAEEAPESEETEEAEEISLSSVLDAVNGLKDQLAALRQENEDLRAQLAAKDEEAKAFVKKFMSLDVSLSDEPKPVVTQKVGYTDGIGEW